MSTPTHQEAERAAGYVADRVLDWPAVLSVRLSVEYDGSYAVRVLATEAVALPVLPQELAKLPIVLDLVSHPERALYNSTWQP